MMFQNQLKLKCISTGIRHFAMLKLIGVGDKASGTVELFPLNGRLWACGTVQVYEIVMESSNLHFIKYIAKTQTCLKGTHLAFCTFLLCLYCWDIRCLC